MKTRPLAKTADAVSTSPLESAVNARIYANHSAGKCALGKADGEERRAGISFCPADLIKSWRYSIVARKPSGVYRDRRARLAFSSAVAAVRSASFLSASSARFQWHIAVRYRISSSARGTSDMRVRHALYSPARYSW